MDQAIALLDAARLDDDPPDTALERLLDATWTTASEHQILIFRPCLRHPRANSKDTCR